MIGGGLEWLRSKERDCLTDEAGIFELRFITPVGGKEAKLDVQIACRLYLVNNSIDCLLSLVNDNCLPSVITCKRRYVPPLTMATRGCRGAVPTQGDESAGGSQAPTQQAQDQTGVPLPPPPPPVDYEALMQGLAPAHEAVFGGVSMMERFRRMTPPFFKWESDPILAESWL
ncbi:hypothetical protein Taro_048018 [Colocasia esculenta]|uniref:Uncharacterized protein n=1 Tax=Colocasia esculenta TaxID=4460 RepID=A0A843WXE6_COLES|nr:hypothetical protein [Colocasia esculenta]